MVDGETSGNSTRFYTVASNPASLRACDPGVAEGDFVPLAAVPRYTLLFPVESHQRDNCGRQPVQKDAQWKQKLLSHG